MKDPIHFTNGKTIVKEAISNSDFELTDEDKISEIEYHFTKIMHTLGLDLTDDSLKDTPKRVAKMYVKELFSGLNPINKPDISLFDNQYNYHNMLIEKNITVYSNCEHHFVPIIGVAHLAYIPHDKVIGLSKLNRIVDYYAKRPQVQERLTVQVADALKEIVGHEDVAVYIEADHLCVASRGVKDTNSETVTAVYSGQFENKELRDTFLMSIENKKE